VHHRHDLTDEEWAVLEPLLPERSPRKARPWKDHRLVVNGVLWRARTGSPWRDLPASYGCWKTVYNRHRRWSADGTWTRVLHELQRGCDVSEEQWVVALDSTVVRAHHHAAGARRLPPKDVPASVLTPALSEPPAPAVSAVSGVVGSPAGSTGGWVE
jgi:transposase